MVCVCFLLSSFSLHFYFSFRLSIHRRNGFGSLVQLDWRRKLCQSIIFTRFLRAPVDRYSTWHVPQLYKSMCFISMHTFIDTCFELSYACDCAMLCRNFYTPLPHTAPTTHPSALVDTLDLSFVHKTRVLAFTFRWFYEYEITSIVCCHIFFFLFFFIFSAYIAGGATRIIGHAIYVSR